MLTNYETFSLGLHELYRSIHKNESAVMNKYGLRGAYVKYLVALLQCPEGLTISQLCEVCDQDKAAVSRAVSELVGREFLWRFNPKGNHYRAKLKLTERGTELAREVCLSGEEFFNEAIAVLSEAQKEELYKTTGLMFDNIHDITMKKIEKFDK